MIKFFLRTKFYILLTPILHMGFVESAMMDDDAEPCVERVFFEDADGDGFGNAEQSLMACEASAGYVLDSPDCDDAAAGVGPGQ